MRSSRALWAQRQPLIKFLGKRHTPKAEGKHVDDGSRCRTDLATQISTTHHTPTQPPPPTSSPSPSPPTAAAPRNTVLSAVNNNSRSRVPHHHNPRHPRGKARLPARQRRKRRNRTVRSVGTLENSWARCSRSRVSFGIGMSCRGGFIGHGGLRRRWRPWRVVEPA